MRPATLVSIGVLGCILASIAVLEQEVRFRADQLSELETGIESNHTAIRVLEAEWAHLNEISNIEQMASLRLTDLTPVTAERIVRMQDLPIATGRRVEDGLAYRTLVARTNSDRLQGAPHGMTDDLAAPRKRAMASLGRDLREAAGRLISIQAHAQDGY